MPEIVRFLVGMAATAADPISAIGYIVAGIVGRRLWHAAAGGAGWAVAMDLFVRTVDPLGYSGHLIAQRIVGGLAVSSAIFAIKLLVRRMRQTGTPPEAI